MGRSRSEVGGGGGGATAVLTPFLPVGSVSLAEAYEMTAEIVGRGQFGTTYVCVERGSGERCACKVMEKRRMSTAEDVEDVRREVAILKHMAGEAGIVQIKGAYEDASHVYLVMELCGGGELFDRIIARGHYSERQARDLARSIAMAVHACHSRGVFHRDLKPENFLFSTPLDDSPLKAIDFGLSVFFRPGQIFTDVVGSPYYVAPEVLRKSYGPEADIWSAGVVVYILLSGVPPFWAETDRGIFEQVLRGVLDFDSDPWPQISESAKDLIRNMLNPKPSERFTALQVLRHPWIREDSVVPDHSLGPAIISRMKQFKAMNKMKRIALRVIAERLSEEEISGLKRMFKMMDTDNSGAITFDELKVGLEKLGSRLMDSEVQTILEAADIDNNGSLDYEEFITATLNLNKIEREDNLFAAFSYFDKDGSGYITVDELQQACIEHKMVDAEVEEMIREIDQNKDGIIDYSEFVAMMRKGNGGVGRRNRTNSLLRDETMIEGL